MSRPPTIEDKLSAMRNLLVQVEAQQSQTVNLARKALGELEEDVRELRRESMKRNVRFYTEAQLAKVVGVSQMTISRMRKKGKLIPCDVGGPIRYSDHHVELLSRVPEPATRPRRGSHLQITREAQAS